MGNVNIGGTNVNDEKHNSLVEDRTEISYLSAVFVSILTYSFNRLPSVPPLFSGSHHPIKAFHLQNSKETPFPPSCMVAAEAS